MKLARRRFLRLAAALPLVARPAWAETYPARPVRLIVGFPAGGSADIVGRLIGQALSERLGQSFVIDNRPGAGSSIGTDAALRAPPDGYTLLLITVANAINPSLYDKLGANFLRDIAPVAAIDIVPNVMEVNPSLPARTVPELIAYAKANPGRISMASGGNGSSQHVAGELFKMMTGIDMVHVPYRGVAPALTDLIAGQVQVLFDTVPASIEHIRAGRLRALAVTTATRSEALPDVPTVAEFVPGYEASSFHGIGAPAGTPDDVIVRLNQEVNAALADAKLKARLADLGGTVLTGSPADFRRLLAEETGKWARVVKFSGAKAE